MGGKSSKTNTEQQQQGCTICKTCEVCKFNESFIKSCTDLETKMKCYKNIIDHISDHINDPTKSVNLTLVEQFIDICFVYEAVYNYARIKGVIAFLQNQELIESTYFQPSASSESIRDVMTMDVIEDSRNFVKSTLPPNPNYTNLSRVDQFIISYPDLVDSKIKKEVFYKRIDN